MTKEQVRQLVGAYRRGHITVEQVWAKLGVDAPGWFYVYGLPMHYEPGKGYAPGYKVAHPPVDSGLSGAPDDAFEQHKRRQWWRDYWKD